MVFDIFLKWVMMKDFNLVKKLVGDIKPQQLRYVDYAVTDRLGIFMPVTGQCHYATSPEHTHPSYLFTVAFDAYCRLRLGGKICESIPSTFTMIPPDVPHQELPSEIVPRYLAVMVEREFFERQLAIYKREITSGLCNKAIPANERLVAALKEFMAEYEFSAPGYGQLLSASAQTITHLFIRLLFGITRESEKIGTRMGVNKAVEYINAHYGEKLSVSHLAYAACLSISHFSRMFKSETGFSPADYLMKTRLDMAKRMLRTGDTSVTCVALNCGFNSTSYFSHCFLRAFNSSPSQFRKSLKMA